MGKKTDKWIYVSVVVLFFTKSFSQYEFSNGTIPKEVSLHNYTTVADVGQRNLDIHYVVANFNSFDPKKLQTENDDLGFSQNNFWSKTELINSSDRTLNYYLETARPITDLVELYFIDSTSGKITKMVSGDNMPFAERSFDNRKTIFKIKILPNSRQQLFLHLKSDGEVVNMPVMLYSSENFIKLISNEQLFFGIFYGILATVSVIYFFFYFALRQKAFLYYSLYVVFIGLMQFSLDGYFYKLITPQGGWFSLRAVLFFAMIAGFLLGKYSEVFLNIKKHNKIIYFLFTVLYFLTFVLIVCILFVPKALALCYPLANVLGLLILILIISSVVYLYCKKIHVDGFFTIGIFFLVLGFGIFILNNFSQIPNSFLTENSSKLGTGLEVIFLSLSMANLIRNLKNEKDNLNRLALIRSEEMNDLKSYFLSNISHELRTPLNAIMNLIESISNEVEDDTIKHKCKIIKYSSNSLLSSVNDILDFSKIEKGELKLENNPFDPVQVLEYLKNNAINIAKEKGLEFQFSKSENIPDFLIGDANRLVQIVNNVLSNAIKFTLKGSVKFTIDAELLPGNRASLILIISDSGVGISPDKKERIFDSFYQKSSDNKKKFSGLGLGLYIVKTLVDMQNGSIKMDSVINVGTTCVLTIDFEVSEQKKSIGTTAKIGIENDLEGKTILVVEDNPINQMVIKMITKKWLNTTVMFANNGQEGIKALIKNQFDIVLMDLQMPVMDGYEATIAIRNGAAGLRNSHIPIIAVTADVMEATKQRVKEIGMNDYLSKPIKKEVLYEAIKKLVN
ncbi:hybrid sensor histidine kinase/response regulator [Flavobacterium sp. RSP49]|uniref:hybrid sensor histidine kinase/response regulator n=1 Tax=unclassified Flavobacterium TaxID=196869 RepID=UPI000F82AC7D|nr:MULTISPECIES: hybrid sensor histidine kinase/response regulator [unclassified Flavobacterium]RTY87852.1 hybrid sensor histidine kinase/response regulator [Flavobacterium sp. RSP15]RTY99680.1 hybrid sensor histidine kinase/response regulator [Flavobacterium sp. RSP49]